MKMYKGFDKGLKCRDFQYEIGKTYEEPTADLCNSGFHACEYPLDVFKYYEPGKMSRYCEVDLDDISDQKDDDSKRCGKKISVKAEIGILGIAKASVDYVMEHIESEKKESNTGNYSAATNTGNYSAATNTGNCSAATNTGNCSAATNTGNYSAATNTGNYSDATNTGNCSAATNTGNCSAATNTGNYSAATNTGDCSAATNTGDYSAATVKGSESVAASLGIDSKASGAIGCWLVLAEWGKDEKENWHRKDVKCFYVDGETVKPDTYYTLKSGQLVEATE